MATEMDDLQSAEQDLAGEIDAALGEISTLAGQLSSTSPSGVEAIAQQLRAKSDQIRAALATMQAPDVGQAEAAAPEPAPAASVDSPVGQTVAGQNAAKP